MKDQKKDYLTLYLLLLIGFAWRLYRLGAQSLWYDETVSAILARKSISELIAHTARDIHPPGYYLLLHGWRGLAGESEFALAYFSLIWGILLIAATYRLGRVMLPASAGLWAAGLVAFSPYNLWYSQEVRMYTLGAFLGVLSTYYGLKALKRTLDQPDQALFGLSGLKSGLKIRGLFWPWLFYSLSAASGLYCLYYFGFLLVALNLFFMGYLIWKTWGQEIGDRGQRTGEGFYRWGARRAWSGWILANLGLVLLYLPWLPLAWRQATNPPVPPWRSQIPVWPSLLETWSALSFGESVQITQIWPALWLTLGLYLLGLGVIARFRWRVLLCLYTFGPFILILSLPWITGAPLYHVRYIFTYSPAFYLVLGAGLAWLWSRVDWVRFLGILGTAGLALGASLSTYQFHTNPQYASDDFRDAVAFIEARWRPGDLILINAGYTYTALAYYLNDLHPVYQRLTHFEPGEYPLDQPLVLETGTVEGLPSLGWGDPKADFYAMSQAETTQALDKINQIYPRIWLLRVYDTVTDPEGIIRRWLSEKTRLIVDQGFTGTSQMRVQGFLTPSQPEPPQETEIYFGDLFILHGYKPPTPSYQAGQALDIAAWWSARPAAATEPPYALSLKLWDDQGNLAAQQDEWPVGNRYFTNVWLPGQIIRHPMRLVLPPTLAPGQYWLDLEIYHSETGLPLSITAIGKEGEADKDQGHVVTLGGITIIP